MLAFSINNDIDAFNNFVEKSGENSFMQTSHWALLKENWKPYMYEGKDAEKLVVTALILERILPVAGKIWYSPSGFIGDYNDENTVKAFSDFIKTEMKKNKVTAYIIDPQIILKVSDRLIDSAVEKTNNLKNAGFKYNENRDDYTYQPPMTLGIFLKNDDGDMVSEKELLKKFEKGVRYSVRIGESRGLKAERYTYDDIAANPQLYDDFLSVMNDTSNRIGFVARPHNYYLGFMKQFAKWGMVDLIYYDKKFDKEINAVNFKKLIDIKEKLKSETKKSKINQLTNEQTSLESALKAYQQRTKEANREDKDKICVACGLTIRFGNEACCLFGGTRDIIRNNVRSSHYLNFLRIRQSIEEGIEFHDLGRVPDEYVDEKSAHHGLYLFKKSFAADRVEYIGEYILVANKTKYFIYNKLMPSVKKARLNMVKALRKMTKRQES